MIIHTSYARRTVWWAHLLFEILGNDSASVCVCVCTYVCDKAWAMMLQKYPSMRASKIAWNLVFKKAERACVPQINWCRGLLVGFSDLQQPITASVTSPGIWLYWKQGGCVATMQDINYYWKNYNCHREKTPCWPLQKSVKKRRPSKLFMMFAVYWFFQFLRGKTIFFTPHLPVPGNFLAVLQILIHYFKLRTISACQLTEQTVLRRRSEDWNIIIASATIYSHFRKQQKCYSWLAVP